MASLMRSRRALAVSLAREGFDRKACNALLAAGLCPDTPDSVSALRALHPVQAMPAVDIDSLPLAYEVPPEVVARVLRQFPADSAPGPCGLRVQRLREAGPPGAANNLHEHLAGLVNLLAQGQACPEVAPVLAGAGLVALPKPHGGVRPIAVGEVLRRLTGKCLMTLARDEARSFFWPVQLGVAVPAGVEAAVHTVRAWFGRNATSSGKLLLKLDFSNAFNTISREHVVAETCLHFPGLARWVGWCYRRPSALQFGSASTVQSAGGVQQGDPLGPLLFSAALQVSCSGPSRAGARPCFLLSR